MGSRVVWETGTRETDRATWALTPALVGSKTACYLSHPLRLFARGGFRYSGRALTIVTDRLRAEQDVTFAIVFRVTLERGASPTIADARDRDYRRELFKVE
jgi:hypothetical protein